jgi:mRNA interferase MazF
MWFLQPRGVICFIYCYVYEMENGTHEKPPRYKPRLLAAPAIRQLYWCDFPTDAHLPEFWKRRPVLVLSFKNTLYGSITVVPCSSQAQVGNPWAQKLNTTIDGSDSWAICDKLASVAVSRLTPDKSGIRRVPEDEFHQVLDLVLKWLPKVPSPLLADASRPNPSAGSKEVPTSDAATEVAASGLES